MAILIVVTLINLRGVSESGGVFLVPTYLFIFCLLDVIAVGVVKTLAAGGHPIPLVPPHSVAGATETLGVWLLARAFASGCTAMTGVEAVSNGVLAFKEPASLTARFTLTVVIGILATLLSGIAFLSKAYGIAATAPGLLGYQSVLSQLIAAVSGKGICYGNLLFQFVEGVTTHGLLASIGRMRQSAPRSQVRMVGVRRKCWLSTLALIQHLKLMSRRCTHRRTVDGSGKRVESWQCGAACSAVSPATMCHRAAAGSEVKGADGASQSGKIVKVFRHGSQIPRLTQMGSCWSSWL